MAKDIRRRTYGSNLRDKFLKKRAVLKNGEYNIIKPKFMKRYLHYLKDIFTSLVDAEWKWTFQVLIVGFVGTWLVFALLWWLIAFVHTDLWDEHLPARQVITGWTPCVLNIYGFHSCFLYSLETQHTTGYGVRTITEECPEAIFLMCAQCIIGMIIDAFTVGVVFAKLTRPTLTASTIQFSKNGIISMRDGVLCLMFRIGNLKKSRVIGVSVRAIVIHKTRTKEGEILENFNTPIDVEYDDSGSDIFMLWPVIVVHKIKENSPFYNMSAIDMLERKYEVILVFDGTVESTGQNTHAKTSYLGEEILWGKKFAHMVEYNNELECFEANYKKFECTMNIRTPLCSAAELEAVGLENTVQTGNRVITPELIRKDLYIPHKPNGTIESSNSSLKIETDSPYLTMDDSGYETSISGSRRNLYYHNLRLLNKNVVNVDHKDLLVSRKGNAVKKDDVQKSSLKVTWV